LVLLSAVCLLSECGASTLFTCSSSSWALGGNFGPVNNEVFAPATLVEGAIPVAVHGVFAKTGPNPVQPAADISASYHWCEATRRPAVGRRSSAHPHPIPCIVRFDGDGMVHLLRIGADSMNFTNVQVQSFSYGSALE
jgi:carotenoid cleavage dioxygenase-like enzyme